MNRKKKDRNQLGKALIRKNRAKQQNKSYKTGDVYTKQWEPETKEKSLHSVLELSDLDLIAYEADISQKRFVAEKQIKVFNKVSLILPDKPPIEVLEEQKKHWNNLVIPRR